MTKVCRWHPKKDSTLAAGNPPGSEVLTKGSQPMATLISPLRHVNTRSSVLECNHVSVGHTLEQFQRALDAFLARKASAAQARFLRNALLPAVDQLEQSLRHASILPRIHGSEVEL